MTAIFSKVIPILAPFEGRSLHFGVRRAAHNVLYMAPVAYDPVVQVLKSVCSPKPCRDSSRPHSYDQRAAKVRLMRVYPTAHTLRRAAPLITVACAAASVDADAAVVVASVLAALSVVVVLALGPVVGAGMLAELVAGPSVEYPEGSVAGAVAPAEPISVPIDADGMLTPAAMQWP